MLPPEVRKVIHERMGELLKKGGSKWSSTALRIWNDSEQAIEGTDTLDELYDAISTEGNRCREFGVLDLESCIPGAEMYYDAEYLARNAKAVPNNMASDLFGHLQGDYIFGAVVVRRKEHSE